MTLDFRKLIRNAILGQMKVQHFECNVQIFKKEELPLRVQQKVAETYGETYLGDANFTVWFSGSNITKEIIEKTLFKIANKSLGEAANNMTAADFKTLDLNATSSTQDVPTETPDDVESMTDASADEANAKAVADLVGTKPAEDQVDESVESPTPGEKFVFLKVTMK